MGKRVWTSHNSQPSLKVRMHIRTGAFVVGVVWLLASCSTTPGDAAHTGGHAEAAAQLYRRGAERGDAEAALKLGLMLHRDKVPSREYGPAGPWFELACTLGQTVGCHNAAVGYEYGPRENDGLEVNFEKAREFYERAAARGYLSSQYNLGTLYANQYLDDDVEGLKWLLIAQRTARSCARERPCRWVLDDPPGHLGKMRRRMSPEAQAMAQQKASEWVVAQ